MREEFPENLKELSDIAVEICDKIWWVIKNKYPEQYVRIVIYDKNA